MREMVAAVGFLCQSLIPSSSAPCSLLCTLLQVDRRPLFLANYLPYRVEDLPSIPLRWGHPPPLLVSKFLSLTAGMGMISLPLLFFSL